MKEWSRLLCTAFILIFPFLPGCTASPAEFVDDFSDPASGWGAASHETYVRGYQQGEYLIQIDVPDWYVWTTAGRSYEDVKIEVAARSAGQTDNHYGALCRYTEQTFYYFAVSTDGYYAIYKHESGGELVPLTGQNMLYSDLVRQEGGDYQIQALCQDTRLALYLNGQLLVEVENEDLVKGDIGIAAGTLASGGTSIWFDDFRVQKP